MCGGYLAIGTLSVFANFLNLAMYIHSKEARKKYTGFIALEIGELIYSVSFILTGAGRLESLKNDHLNAPTTTHSCFYGKYWPHAQILGTELPTLFLILTSFQRIWAVRVPLIFNEFYSKRRQIWMIAICVALASYVVGVPVRRGCICVQQQGLEQIRSLRYSTFHFIFIIIGYGVSLLSLVMLKIYTEDSQLKTYNDLRKETISKKVCKKSVRQSKKAPQQDFMTNILIAFNATSMLLVAAPSFVMIGLSWSWFALDDIWVALAYSVTALVSIANMIINVIFRKDFRLTLSRWTSRRITR